MKSNKFPSILVNDNSEFKDRFYSKKIDNNKVIIEYQYCFNIEITPFKNRIVCAKDFWDSLDHHEKELFILREFTNQFTNFCYEIKEG